MKKYSKDDEGGKVREHRAKNIVVTKLEKPSGKYEEEVLKPLQEIGAKLDRERARRRKLVQKTRQMTEDVLQKYKCSLCGWVYDPEEGDPKYGIGQDTPFKWIPKDWICPSCGADKGKFDKILEEKK